MSPCERSPNAQLSTSSSNFVVDANVIVDVAKYSIFWLARQQHIEFVLQRALVVIGAFSISCKTKHAFSRDVHIACLERSYHCPSLITRRLVRLQPRRL